MSGDEFNIPMKILEMMVAAKEHIRVETILDRNYPVLPHMAVEIVVKNIFRRIDDELRKIGQPTINMLQQHDIVEKFLDEIASLIFPDGVCEKARSFYQIRDQSSFSVVKDTEALEESTDESVDTYFGLRYRDLEAEGMEIFIPSVKTKYRPTTLDFCHLFRNLSSSSPLYKLQDPPQIQEKLKKHETVKQSSKVKKSGRIKQFFAPFLFWKKTVG